MYIFNDGSDFRVESFAVSEACLDNAPTATKDARRLTVKTAAQTICTTLGITYVDTVDEHLFSQNGKVWRAYTWIPDVCTEYLGHVEVLIGEANLYYRDSSDDLIDSGVTEGAMTEKTI